MKARDLIRKYGPCEDAVAWMADRSPRKAWEQCERSDWMLWIAARVGVTDPELRALARRFAVDVIDLWDAPTVARQYLETGDESLRLAAAEAAWAARSAAWSATGAAARSAAWAAEAAWAAARSAEAAVEAATWAARSAAAQKRQCDQIRALLPWERMAQLVGLSSEEAA